MVDATQGSGPVQDVTARRTQAASNERRTERQEQSSSSREVRDEVSISEAAISLQQAEQAASDIRTQLESSNESLGGDVSAIQDLLGEA